MQMRTFANPCNIFRQEEVNKEDANDSSSLKEIEPLNRQRVHPRAANTKLEGFQRGIIKAPHTTSLRRPDIRILNDDLINEDPHVMSPIQHSSSCDNVDKAMKSPPFKRIQKVKTRPVNTDGILELVNDDDSIPNLSDDELWGWPDQIEEVNSKLHRKDTMPQLDELVGDFVILVCTGNIDSAMQPT